jgi:hypothetical protein
VQIAGATDGIRSNELGSTKPLLYQLSYGGIGSAQNGAAKLVAWAVRSVNPPRAYGFDYMTEVITTTGLPGRATRDLDKLSAGRPTSIELLTPFAEQMDVAVISQDDGFLAI